MKQSQETQLAVHLNSIDNSLKFMKDNLLPEIRTEVKDTNGKVAEIIKWRERLKGGSMVVGAIFGVFILTFIWTISEVVQLGKEVAVLEEKIIR